MTKRGGKRAIHGFVHATREQLDNLALTSTDVLVDGGRFTLHRIAGRGRKGVVWEARNENGRPRAVKFVTLDEYDSKLPYREFLLGANLEQFSCFAQIERTDIIEIQLGGTTCEVAAFVSEWLDGITLEAILSDPAPPEPSLIVSYANDIADALAALDANKLAHDDLNFGNVMLCDPPKGAREKIRHFKIIDLGSLKPRDRLDPAKKKGIDDYRWVGLHLAALHNATRKRSSNSPRDRRFLLELKSIIASILDEDPATRLRDPNKLAELIEFAWANASTTRQKKVATPFEFISAEQIADDALLYEIFTTSLPWLPLINNSTPEIISGPRGCGKSSLFRFLRLRTHVNVSPAGFSSNASPTIAGFYLACGIDIQPRLGWLTEASMTEVRRAETVHLFNLLLLREVVGTLAAARRTEGQFQISDSAEREVFDAIQEIAGESIKRTLYSGVGRLAQLTNSIRREIWTSHERIRLDQRAAYRLTDEATLGQITQVLVDTIPLFDSYRPVFLLDDFSFHRVPRCVQQVLLPVIWARMPSHSFKVSTEKQGTFTSFKSGATAELGRELVEHDLGAIALDNTSGSDLRKFAEDLLNQRLKACNYQATAAILLGETNYGKTHDGNPLSLAEALRKDAESGQAAKRRDVYHGLDTISQICSGDVSALLLVFERIFSSAKIGPSTVTQVSAAVQSKAIKSVSSDLLDQLRSFHGSGEQMHAFVQEYGRFIRKVLIEAPLQEKGLGKGRPAPQQIPRIEVDDISRVYSRLRLNQNAQSVFDDLLRRAVLIQLPTTTGRHEGVTSLRLHLRKVFLPAFNAALGKNVSLNLKADDFVTALIDPAASFKVAALRKLPAHSSSDPDLFEEEEQ